MLFYRYAFYFSALSIDESRDSRLLQPGTISGEKQLDIVGSVSR